MTAAAAAATNKSVTTQAAAAAAAALPVPERQQQRARQRAGRRHLLCWPAAPSRSLPWPKWWGRAEADPEDLTTPTQQPQVVVQGSVLQR